VVRASDAKSAVAADVAIVLSLVTASTALEAARDALVGLRPETIYADLTSAAPQLKREVARVVETAAAQFADVALMGVVPALGLGTPALASGRPRRPSRRLSSRSECRCRLSRSNLVTLPA